MSTAYIAGMVVGMVVAIIIAAATFYITGKKKTWRYDERQQLARAKAIKWAYIALITGICVTLLAVSTELVNHMQIVILLTASALASALVFACVCIHNDAWMALNEKPRSVITILIFALAANLILPMGSLIMGEMVGTAWLNFAAAVLLAVILINYGIHRLILRRENDEESAS